MDVNRDEILSVAREMEEEAVRCGGCLSNLIVYDYALRILRALGERPEEIKRAEEA